jgi:8-oxo-dGTP pyrophosphatase MutT (NUDIX family)
MVAQQRREQLGSLQQDRDLHRMSLLQLLTGYAASHGNEGAVASRILSLVEREPRCFERNCYRPGHITASCWIVSADGERVLLTHHRKLHRWLQLGGHADGETDVLSVALREAREESGMSRFSPIETATPDGLLDLDVHSIPERPGEPAHEHHDVRFLLRAHRDQTLVQSNESLDLRWFARKELGALDLDESVLRLRRKADQWLGDARAQPA